MVAREGAKRRAIAGLAQTSSQCARAWYAQARRGCADAGLPFTFADDRRPICWGHFRGARGMSWFGIVLVVIGLVLALKMAGFVMKLAMWALVLFGLYWFLAPRLGLPWPF